MGWVRGGHNGKKNKFALKCFSGKIKCSKTMLVFFLMENWGIEDPPSQLNGKIQLTFFFETVSKNELYFLAI